MKSELARRLYSTVSYLATPLALARLVIKSGSHPGYRSHISERFGFFEKSHETQVQGRSHVHFHAVSVGETFAAMSMVKSLEEAHKDWNFSVSVTTPTGRDQAEKHLSDIADICFLPFDLPGSVNRFLNSIKPDILVIVETELWPNLIAQCNSRGVPTLLMNARMSEKSAISYQKMSAVTRPMMAQLDLVLAQSESDAKRFIQLGCIADRVLCAGNVKFDIQLTPELKQSAEKFRSIWQLQSRKVWIAASTHPGEEAQLLNLHKELLEQFPNLLMILVPRHPERRKEVQKITLNLELSAALRSQSRDTDIPPQVLIVDTLGELTLFYGLADIAFIGGSLVPHGGHNPIEPALWELPILTGVHCHNFNQITHQLVQAGSLVQCQATEQLLIELRGLLQDENAQTIQGEKSSPVLKSNLGSLQRQQKNIEALLSQSNN